MKLRQVGAVLAAASIVLAACGDDDDNASDTTTVNAQTASRSNALRQPGVPTIIKRMTGTTR